MYTKVATPIGEMELVEHDCSVAGPLEAVTTAVAFSNTRGGALLLRNVTPRMLGRILRGLSLDASPPPLIAYAGICGTPPAHSLLLAFSHTGALHKVRCVGKFIRKDGKNQRIRIDRRRALDGLLWPMRSGQQALFGEGAVPDGETITTEAFSVVSAPLSLSSLYEATAELFSEERETRDVFLSYSHQDRHVATRMRDALERFGFSVWLDTTRLEAGDWLSSEIGRGIGGSKVGVVLASRYATESKWVRSEISLMIFKRRFDTVSVLYPILPVRLDSEALPSELEGFLALEHPHQRGASCEFLVSAVRRLLRGSATD